MQLPLMGKLAPVIYQWSKVSDLILRVTLLADYSPVSLHAMHRGELVSTTLY